VKLLEALEVLKRSAPAGGPPLRASLACGFTPLHLETFLHAHLRQAFPSRPIEVSTGLFGDLAGNLERAEASGADAVAVVIEWPDVDPRLGLRSLGGWRPADVDDILAAASERLDGMRDLLLGLGTDATVVCSLPTLPLPPLFSPAPGESGAQELRLRQLVATFGASLAGRPGVRLVSAERLDARSPSDARLDVKAELTAGFPYRLAHASTLAEALVTLIRDVPPKKGLITDLDDVLWSGLVGEVGGHGVGWTLEAGAQEHGLYQQLLASLAGTGVLVGVASKNEVAFVEEAFRRDDIVLPAESVFPLEIGWGPKSESVRRILDAWNVGPDAVVFVDDSPTELAEVQAAFPEVECLLFPTGDHAGVLDFLWRLRELFGKRSVSEEDAIRLSSIRSSVSARAEAGSSGYSDDFLDSAAGKLTFTDADSALPRALELINKTNQFNLNGRRLTEPELRKALQEPDAFLLTASYRDRFGPLGKIATLLGRRAGDGLVVDSWVMSCRAFSRRIEHHFVAYLFERFGVDEIAFDYEPTARNVVLQEFMSSVADGDASGRLRMSRSAFLDGAPALVHHVNEDEDE
jgi:FkbH-like protein